MCDYLYIVIAMDLLILGTALLVLLFRLWSLLGERSPDEKPPRGLAPLTMAEDAAEAAREVSALGEQEQKRQSQEQEQTIPVKDQAVYEKHPVLKEVASKDPQFSLDDFFKGARYAFATIIEAFTNDSLQTIRPLLSPKVMARLREALRERNSHRRRQETHVISVDKCEIVDVSLEKGKIYLTVQFLSTQINALYDTVGKLVDGDPQKMNKISDKWTFVRPLRAQDPNWTLSDIHAT